MLNFYRAATKFSIEHEDRDEISVRTPMGAPLDVLGAWLSAVREDLGRYAAVLTSDGVRSVADLRQYDDDDLTELDKALAKVEAERFTRKLILNAIRQLRTVPAVSEKGSVTPSHPNPGRCGSSSSGLGSAAFTDRDTATDEHRGNSPAPVINLLSGTSSAAGSDLFPDARLSRPYSTNRKYALSTAQQSAAEASEDAGTSKVPTGTPQVNGRASRASQASQESGTARVPSAPPTEDGQCARCFVKLRSLLERANSLARRSPSDLNKMKEGKKCYHSTWNYTKLKELLATECFSATGCYELHFQCIQRTFSLSSTC